jgi:hypothetical protein
MQVQVFKSEFTGELFEDENEYQLHLEGYEEQKKVEEKQKELFAKSKEMKQMPRLTATSIEDFRQKAFDVINELNEGNPDKLLILNFSGVRISDVSNTHSAPIGFEQNFSKKADKPTSYKGWYGNITIVLSQDMNTGDNRNRIENLIKYFPGINTGSGGYRGKEYGDVKGYVLEYSLRLYLEDFPLIKEQYQRYLELKESKEEWQSDISILCEAKNEADEVMVSYESVYDDYNEKIKTMEAERLGISNLMTKRRSENNESVLLSNHFKELEELNLLSKQLNVSNVNGW